MAGMWMPTAGRTSRGLLLSLICYYQVVCNLDVYYVPANLNLARGMCDANGLVLPRTAADNMRVVQQLQQSYISATWIDFTISPAPWNWITDGDYANHYDQGCYNLSSLQLMMSNNGTNVHTCMELCAGYVYVGLQATSQDSVSCVCTNEADIASAVSEFRCHSVCDVSHDRLLCGNNKLNTFRLLSTRGLSSSTNREVPHWNDNHGLDTTSPILCASLLIRASGSGLPYIRLIPQDCRTELLTICESDNGTVTSLDRASWFEARQLCRERGMKIVRVFSPNQTNILAANIPEGWTALRGWTWRSHGLEICDLVFTNLSEGYPKKSEGECIAVLKDGSWKNVPCDAEMTFICVTSLNISLPTECGSLIPTTSASTSYQTDPHATTTSKPITTTTSEPHRKASSEANTPTPSLTDVIHITSSAAHFTIDRGQASDTNDDAAGGLDMVGVALGTSIAILVLAAGSLLDIFYLRRSKTNRKRPPAGNLVAIYENVTPKLDNSSSQSHIYEMPARVSEPEVHDYDTLADINLR